VLCAQKAGCWIGLLAGGPTDDVLAVEPGMVFGGVPKVILYQYRSDQKVLLLLLKIVSVTDF
jgi:hypothetical protein